MPTIRYNEPVSAGKYLQFTPVYIKKCIRTSMQSERHYQYCSNFRVSIWFIWSCRVYPGNNRIFLLFTSYHSHHTYFALSRELIVYVILIVDICESGADNCLSGIRTTELKFNVFAQTHHHGYLPLQGERALRGGYGRREVACPERTNYENALMTRDSSCLLGSHEKWDISSRNASEADAFSLNGKPVL